jgi:hypothetical protein
LHVFDARKRANIVPPSERTDFRDKFRDARTVRILTISGTKNAGLGDEATINALFENLKNKKVEILLANPNSEALKNRYRNDEPNSHEVGLEGLKARLTWLETKREELDRRYRDNVDVRVYSSYPTVNFVQVDGEYYSSVFGYKLRGSDCPITYSEQGSYHSDFLTSQFQRIYADATPLEDWHEKQSSAGG